MEPIEEKSSLKTKVTRLTKLNKRYLIKIEELEAQLADRNKQVNELKKELAPLKKMSHVSNITGEREDTTALVETKSTEEREDMLMETSYS